MLVLRWVTQSTGDGTILLIIGLHENEIRMAIVFELSIHFGTEALAAHQFVERIKQRYCALSIGSHVIDLHQPLVSTFRDGEGVLCFEVSIIPIAVSFGVALDKDRPHLRLTTEELSHLGHQLYAFLKGLDGYQVAAVGWDVDRFDLAELRSEYKDEIMDGSMHGLVIAQTLRSVVPASSHFVAFDESHDWIPYRGTHAVT
jgi:hypothetical protein